MTIPRLQQVATITVVLLLLVVLFVPLPSCSNEALVEKPAVVEREQEAQAEDRSADQTLVQKKSWLISKGRSSGPVHTVFDSVIAFKMPLNERK
ncbi:hypothetical protein [Exiguobacterium artemiae]